MTSASPGKAAERETQVIVPDLADIWPWLADHLLILSLRPPRDFGWVFYRSGGRLRVRACLIDEAPIGDTRGSA